MISQLFLTGDVGLIYAGAMGKRRVKRASEEVIEEMLELYTMRPPVRTRKVLKVKPDRPLREKNNAREDKKPC